MRPTTTPVRRPTFRASARSESVFAAPVTKAADILQFLLLRPRSGSPLDHLDRLLGRVPRAPGLSESWRRWLRSGPALVRRGDAAIVALMAARPPLAPAGRHPGLSWLQAFRQLWWQHWDPPAADQRGLRWLAALCSLVLHLLFAVFLIWVALIRTPSSADDSSEGQRVEVAYIGRGTPDQEGGGAPAAGAAGDATAQRAASARSSAPPSAAAATLPAQPVERETLVNEAASEPQPAPAIAQPLQVTEVPEPISEFVLPPPNTLPPRIDVPQLRTPEVRVELRPVASVEERPAALQLRTPQVLRPELAVPQIQVREREITVAPQQPLVTAVVPGRELQAQLRAPEITVRELQIPAAADAPLPAANADPVAMPATTPDAGLTATATPPAAGVSSVSPVATTPGRSAGAGPRPQDQAGGWDAPVRADDWGAAKNTAAGSSGRQANAGDGVFNADGSVRVPGAGAGSAQAEQKRGAPGGDSDSWTRDRIADSGTWLKRPPYDYTPTSFEKYWVPSESLLAEWVRKGIKSIEIPIPGTNTRISCVVSMLQFGGGCGLSNPNMQEQPAAARPPPDIPFKQELQEDNGSR